MTLVIRTHNRHCVCVPISNSKTVYYSGARGQGKPASKRTAGCSAENAAPLPDITWRVSRAMEIEWISREALRIEAVISNLSSGNVNTSILTSTR
jgi:hypothetical protein